MQSPAGTSAQKHPWRHIRAKTYMLQALAATLVLHAVILLLPLGTQKPTHQEIPVEVRLQLVPWLPQTVTQESATSPDKKFIQDNPESQSVEMPLVTNQDSEFEAPLLQESQQVPSQKGEESLDKLRNRILLSPYIENEPVSEKLFGKPREQTSTGSEFHYPQRENMISLLNTPIPDLPFDYAPGLIKFSYASGVRGDMQRFFDKITPEFGWTTKYGTKVQCAWVLVIVACGWGR